MKTKQEILSQLPAVDELLREGPVAELLESHPRELVVNTIREELDDTRRRILEARETAAPPEREAIISAILQGVSEKARPSLRRVVNATGVVVHTNLGRSILPAAAIKQVVELSEHYSNLEFDLEAGRRGSRYSHVESLLQELTGAEAALVVNNNAAAVYLSLQTHAQGKEVIVSRGQLVEIGGSFRIPDVMARSGAILVEVGATNKTHLHDYQNALTENTGMLLKVHTSNFQIIGFTAEVALEELVKLGREHAIPVMEDLGSGCFLDLSRYGLKKEPTVQEALDAGADIVTFSGDKLMGGPQAGLILGKAEHVNPIKKNPVNRAFRIDKMTLAALEATLRLYRRKEDALREIPTLAMLTVPLKTLQSRARRLKRKLDAAAASGANVEITAGSSRVGGGALPAQELPTRLVAISPTSMSAAHLEERLRASEPPIICRIEQEKVLMDVRTIQDDDIPFIERTIASIVG